VIGDTAATPEWTRREERGTLSLYRFIAWFSLAMGRAPARAVVRVAMLYYLVFAGSARRASGEYLSRCLGRRPTLAEQYHHIVTFALTVHDRVFFLRDRFDLFELEVHGAECFDEHGAVLMGAHLGSFEALRAAGRGLGGRRIAMAMYEENAQKVNAVLAAIAPHLQEDIVPLGRLDAILELEARLEQGALVGVLADRTLEGDAQGSLEVDFLGKAARFPLGPMRMAAALRTRVIFMTALYRGGNRYEIHFEPLADFRDTRGARTERDARVRDAVRSYVARLERHARSAPDNWFNFYRFWGP
jgi:predicted LPLAT superfamily acyltransferase